MADRYDEFINNPDLTGALERYHQGLRVLQQQLGVTETILAGLLQVTVQSLFDGYNCDRPMRLALFVEQALELGVPQNLLLNVLLMSIGEDGEDSSSILHHIVHSPLTKTEYGDLIRVFLAIEVK